MWSLTVPLLIISLIVTQHGAPVGLVTCCLQFPIKSGATRFKVCVTLLSRWKVTPFQQISELQATAWLIFTSLPCIETSQFQVRKKQHLTRCRWLMGFLPICFSLRPPCRGHWVIHVSRQPRWLFNRTAGFLVLFDLLAVWIPFENVSLQNVLTFFELYFCTPWENVRDQQWFAISLQIH